jgi:hypothetical protein
LKVSMHKNAARKRQCRTNRGESMGSGPVQKAKGQERVTL